MGGGGQRRGRHWILGKARAPTGRGGRCEAVLDPASHGQWPRVRLCLPRGGPR